MAIVVGSAVELVAIIVAVPWDWCPSSHLATHLDWVARLAVAVLRVSLQMNACVNYRTLCARNFKTMRV